MNIILFDNFDRKQLFPFTYTRHIADIRCGIMTMRERWEFYCQQITQSLCDVSLQMLYPTPQSGAATNLYINAACFATPQIWQAILQLNDDNILTYEQRTIAFKTKQKWNGTNINFTSFTSKEFAYKVEMLTNPWDIFKKNSHYINEDFELMTAGKQSAPLPDYVTAIAPKNIFIAPDASIMPCIINASGGKVYIGEKAEIMEGCLIKGSMSLGKKASLKMGAKVYGGTTIGDGCKVGGEINNVVFFANSNKGHDGFIGNAVIGEWCNLGADTNCSNLKNNYEEIKIWSESLMKYIKTGLQFCGLLMGDHSKCGINTMFNTGTVVGVSCNIFGAGFPDKFIPSFTWGGVENSATYTLDKAIETANRMMERRGKKLSKEDIQNLTWIFEYTQKQRDLLH